jgi:hypothetical protein
MNCKQTRRRFDAAYDGTLAGRARDAFDAHLDGCAACRSEFEALSAAVSVLDVGPLAATPPDHVAQVMARVRAGVSAGDMDDDVDAGAVLVPVRRRRPAPFVVLMSHLAAAAIGGLIVWFLVDTARGAFESVRGAGSERVAGLDRARRVTDGAQDVGSGATPAATPNDQLAVAPPRLVFHPLQLQITRNEVVMAAPLPAPIQVDPRAAIERERLRAERRRAAAAGTLALAVARTAGALDRIAVASEESERLARATFDLARAEAESVNSSGGDGNGRSGTGDPLERGGAPGRVLAVATSEPEGAVLVERDGDRIRIATSGPTNEVVPALIALLGDPDERVRESVDRRLRAIAEDLGLPTPEDLAGARSTTAMADPWWRSQRGQAATASIASIASDGAGTGREERWRAWWNAVRSD